MAPRMPSRSASAARSSSAAIRLGSAPVNGLQNAKLAIWSGCRVMWIKAAMVAAATVTK